MKKSIYQTQENLVLQLSNHALRIPSFFQVVKASFLKDIKIFFKYKANFISNFIRAFAFIAVFYLFAISFKFKQGTNDKTSMLLFFLSGLIIIMYDGAAFWGPVETVNRDLYNGTLEYVYSNPSSRIAYFIGGTFSEAFYASYLNLPLLLVLLFLGKASFTNALLIIGVLLATNLVLTGIGVMMANLTVLWKQTRSLLNVITNLFLFTSGFLIPIQSFPHPLVIFSYFIPYTWGIELIRVYLFGTTYSPLLPIEIEWALLFFQVIIAWALAILLTRKSEQRIKKTGLHLI